MTQISSKLPILLFLLTSLIFFSSCSTSYHAGRYNRLDWVQKKSGITTPDEAKVTKEQPTENINSLSATSQSPIIELQKPLLELLKNDPGVNSSIPDKQKLKAYSKFEKKIEAEIAKSNIPWKIQSLKHSIHPNSTPSISGTSDRFSGLDPDLRTGIIFIVAGLLLSLLWVLPSPVGYIFGTIGSIAIVIGLIFILLYLLDA
jgi:hypothetical protein